MTVDPIQLHYEESIIRQNIQSDDSSILRSAHDFFVRSHQLKYSYNFSWFGRPIIQYPQDIVAFQEIVASVKPDLIIETGVAHGGSLILSASLLALLDIMDSVDPRESNRKVVGIDIDIRSHNRAALDNHPLRFKLDLLEGSSIDQAMIDKVHSISQEYKNILVCLDSNHTHEHVLSELNAYAPLVSQGSYCIVFDTSLDDMPSGSFPDRPWDKGNNPKTAVFEWIKDHPEFIINKHIDNKLLISVTSDGYLQRVD